MLLNEYIERFSLREYPVFAPEDRAETVLHVLEKKGRFCAPVVKEGRPAGLVTLSLLLGGKENGDSRSRPLSSFSLEKLPVASLTEHLLDVYSKAIAFRGEIVAVIDHEGLFVAVIEKNRLAREIAALYHLGTGESVTLELEVPPSGVRMSEVLAVFEKNDAAVQSFGVMPPSIEGEGLLLCLRVQTADLFRLASNLEKYGYSVRYHSPASGSGDDELREKALEFIRYLDM